MKNWLWLLIGGGLILIGRYYNVRFFPYVNLFGDWIWWFGYYMSIGDILQAIGLSFGTNMIVREVINGTMDDTCIRFSIDIS